MAHEATRLTGAKLFPLSPPFSKMMSLSESPSDVLKWDKKQNKVGKKST